MIEEIETRAQLMAFRDRYGMRKSWHEPDEQDVDAYPAVGRNFDNASCRARDFDVRCARRQDEGGIYDTVYEIHTTSPCAEHGIFLFHEGRPVAFVNLALLLAMASGYEDS